MLTSDRASGRPARAVLSLVFATLLALASVAPGQAAGPPRDDAGSAIGRVREALRSRGRPPGGPMEATLVRPYASPDDLGRAWIVLADDGVFLVWGGVSGPLGPDEARMLQTSCLCDFALPAPGRMVGLPAPFGF